MGYEAILRSIDTFEQVTTNLGIEVPERSSFARYLSLVKEFLDDQSSSIEGALDKWMARDFGDWYWAMLSVEKLTSAVAELQSKPDDLKKLVPLAVLEDIKQDFKPTQAKTYLYELQIGAWFHKAGFNVQFEEPDIRISGNGLSQTVAIACKYPSSENKLDRRISEGYEQIERQGLKGVVAVGMDILVCRGMKKFVKFPDSRDIILRSMEKELSIRVAHILKRRAGVEGRKSLNGAVFTLSMAGICHRHLQIASQFVFQSCEDNPLNPDLGVISKAIESLS